MSARGLWNVLNDLLWQFVGPGNLKVSWQRLILSLNGTSFFFSLPPALFVLCVLLLNTLMLHFQLTGVNTARSLASRHILGSHFQGCISSLLLHGGDTS